MTGLKSRIMTTAFSTLLAFLSIGYVACSKDETPSATDKCDSIVCENGGTCFKGMCTCPVGYEGERCQTSKRAKYLGKWKVKETITGSSIDSMEGKQKNYEWTIKQDADRDYAFFIDNFMGVSTNNNISGVIGFDSKGKATTSDKFSIGNRTLDNSQRMQLLGGYGGITGNTTIMSGVYHLVYFRDSIPVFDTISFGADYAGVK